MLAPNVVFKGFAIGKVGLDQMRITYGVHLLISALAHWRITQSRVVLVVAQRDTKRGFQVGFIKARKGKASKGRGELCDSQIAKWNGIKIKRLLVLHKQTITHLVWLLHVSLYELQ